jgi:four helix bundle protein
MGDILDLEVLQLLHRLTLRIYDETKSFPPEEKFGLVAQLRRSSASVPTNIVEGNQRFSTKEYLHLLSVARGSLAETEYHLLLAKDLGFLKKPAYEEMKADCEKAGRMLNGLIKSLARKSPSTNRHPRSDIRHHS